MILPLGMVAAVVVSASIAGAHIISDETDTDLRNTLFGGGFGLVVTFIIFMLALWMSQLRAVRAEPPAEELPKALVPLEALPPYQPIRAEPTITIQIPTRTVVALVVSLAVLAMIYLRVLRGERGDTL
jgi:hypothetical protein